jgi:hypothetical protein
VSWLEIQGSQVAQISLEEDMEKEMKRERRVWLFSSNTRRLAGSKRN